MKDKDLFIVFLFLSTTALFCLLAELQRKSKLQNITTTQKKSKKGTDTLLFVGLRSRRLSALRKLLTFASHGMD